MKRPAGMAAPKRELRSCGFLLAAAIAVSAPLSVAGASGSPVAIASGKIAFVSSRDGNAEIYTINTDGTGLTRLTNDLASDEEPAWSPDGQRIAFVSSRSGTSQIYVMNGDGSNVVRLTFSASSIESPSWSPDATKIVYSTVTNGSANLWVVSPNAGGPGSTLLFEARGWDAEPSWSPDGTRIALVSDWHAFDFVFDIILINADGSGLTDLTANAFDRIDYFRPSWSPDGARIAHVVREGRGSGQPITTLAVMNADGTGQMPLIPAATWAEASWSAARAKNSWSPDGQVIAFTSGTPNTLDVSWVAADGSASGLIVANGWNPSWRPVASGALDLSVGTDNRARLLSTSLDNRAVIRSFDDSGISTSSGSHGPYSGWNARAVADGPDGLTRVLWIETGGRVGLSLIDAGHIVATHRFAGARGWSARDIAVGSDNQTRILWANTDGRMALWSVDNSGALTNSGTVYGPPLSGQAATRVSAGADGLTRVLWTSPDGTGTLWLMSRDNVRQGSFGFGPN